MTTQTYLPNGRLDIHHALVQYKSQERKLLASASIAEKNKKHILDFLRDCELGKTILSGQKRQLGHLRLLKYLALLRHLAEWIGKDFETVTQKEMEDFILGLEKDRITRKNGSPFQHNTKRDYKLTLRKFYKWLLGGNEVYPPIVRWIDTRDQLTEIPCLRKEEIERMSQATGSTRDRAILWTLFDSGTRVEEFLNIRMRNLEEIRDDHGALVYRVRIEHSKTKPRSILLPIASPHLREFLRIEEGRKPEDFVFPIGYRNLAKVLNHIGTTSISRKVHPHLLRHSSATYYAAKLSRASFCNRFGWSFASNMPDRYIDREALTDRESVQAVRTETVQDLKRENTTLKEDLAQVRDQMNQIHTYLNTLTNDPVIVRQIAKATERLKQGEKLRELRITLT